MLPKLFLEQCVWVQSTFRPKNTGWRKYFLVIIYFSLIPSEFQFYTFRYCSRKVFFWLNLFCTFTLLHNALEKYFFCLNLFYIFTILHNVLQKFFFVSESVLLFYTFTQCSEKVVWISAKYIQTDKYWLKKVFPSLNLFCTYSIWI